jgi:hypothetical protein
MDERLPRVQFTQNGYSSCLFSSLASALCYLGLHDAANTVASEAIKYSADTDLGVFNWNALLLMMGSKCKFLQPRKLHGNALNLLVDISEFPTVMSLEAQDGGTQHAIAVVGRLIFDSNCDRALPLSQSSLDYCCSTDSVAGTFKNVYKGYRFQPDPADKRHRHLAAQFKEKSDEIDLMLMSASVERDYLS